MGKTLFSLQLKSVSRSRGRSAAGLLAYITGQKTKDVYTGDCFDYGRKRGIKRICPVGFSGSVQQLAEKLDSAEKRCNSQVAREIILALPNELSDKERDQLCYKLGKKIYAKWGCIGMFATHEASKEGEQRNEHAHFVWSTRNELGKKIRKLDVKQTSSVETEWVRSAASEIIRESLRKRGLDDSKWNHESYEKQENGLIPGRHEGPLVTSMKRKKKRKKWFNDEVFNRAKERMNKEKSLPKGRPEVER